MPSNTCGAKHPNNAEIKKIYGSNVVCSLPSKHKGPHESKMGDHVVTWETKKDGTLAWSKRS